MKKMRKTCLLFCVCLMLGACTGAQGRTERGSGETEQRQVAEIDLSFANMKWEKGLALSYANQFFVEKSEAYYLITIVANDRFLLIPEKGKVPKDIPDDVILLQMPLDHVYLASSSVFDLVRQAGALEHLRLSGTKKEDLCIAEALDLMEKGQMLYAGKYNKPDYELLVKETCDLAIENTMIYHNPEAKEKLETLGIPVLVETSSYEEHPFGRMEWIKLYGLLFDHLQEAESFFAEQVDRLEPILQQEKTAARIAFFYVNSNGIVNVRKPGDYVAKMISLAGGNYVPDTQPEEENALSTMNMQMEDFYLSAKDADLIVYNSTIVGELSCVQDLIDLNPVFADFKAVKEGRVYCTGKNFFQETTALGEFVEDLGYAIRNPQQTAFHQLIKLK